MDKEFLYWKNIKPGHAPPEQVFALIECPRGTNNKYELSKTTNLLVLDRVLHSSVIYPADYGLIPGTYADDGDPLDILVLMSNPTAPLTIVETKPIGVMMMEDEKGVDEKILSVAIHDPFFSGYSDISSLPPHYTASIQEFFRTYKALEEPKYAEVKEWMGRKSAFEIINQCIDNFTEKFGEVPQILPVEP